MSSFLELCQRVRQECGIAGEGNPTTVVAQTGILGRIVSRTSRAWVDIQASRPYWKFLHSQLTFTTTEGVRTYAVGAGAAIDNANVDKWDTDSAFQYLDSTDDEQQLYWKDYQWFRRMHRTFPDGRPTEITEQPGRILAFDFTPDDVYTTTIDYWKTPELLSADDDVPACPEHYQDCIVWKAVMMHAGAVGDVALYNHAFTQYKPIYFQLVVDQGDVPSALKNYPIARGNQRVTHAIGIVPK